MCGWEIERKLKAGELRCVVCSTSLELGIDIGSIDRVVLLTSPRGGGAGAAEGGTVGAFAGGDGEGDVCCRRLPADLIESMVTADAMRKRAIGGLRFRLKCLDVLAQHLIGMALQWQRGGIGVEHAFEVVRRSFVLRDWGGRSLRRCCGISRRRSCMRRRGWAAKLFVEETEGGIGLHPLRKSMGGWYAQNVGDDYAGGQVTG